MVSTEQEQRAKKEEDFYFPLHVTSKLLELSP